MPEASVIHRALASPTRERLLDVLRAADAPMSSRELGSAVDLHPNTVRSHLGILVNARLVSCSRRAPCGRGRPQHVYAAIDEAGVIPRRLDEQSYDLLAAVLADRVRLDHPDAGVVVEETAARSMESRIGSDPPPATDEEAVGRLVEELAVLGFASHTLGNDDGSVCLVADRCPIAAVARTYPDVACSFHRGVVRGLLGNLGGRVGLAGFEVDPAGEVCRATLRTAA